MTIQRKAAMMLAVIDPIWTACCGDPTNLVFATAV